MGVDHASAEFYFRDLPLTVQRGHPLPLGASPAGEDEVNFVLISRHATSVKLVLLESCNSEIRAVVPLDAALNRTGNHWHVRVKGLPETFCYGYQVDGPKGPQHRYDPNAILLDPAARSLSCGRPWGSPPGMRRHSLVSPSLKHRREDVPPRIRREDLILYEVHVRGFTIHPSAGVRHAGTFAGLIDKIAYLQELGVNAVELLPIHEFDENDCPFVNPFTGEKLKNYWGYNTISFAAIKSAFASNPEGSAPWDEFRRLVRAMHEAGIEVVLDVVFNHTAEGSEKGPTHSFRGLDNSLYYLVDERGRYLNYTGCGNTINSNHPVVRSLLLSCLRAAVAEAGVDGFRFDLASVFGRDRNGHILVEPPVVEMITEDALLAETKLIAEPWDASGLYQVGSFPVTSRWSDQPEDVRWSEWNGRFRDDVRKFWRGDLGMVSALATRICGSDDLYAGRGPLQSVNFITCHDGFTLADLVSYNHKHNHANGEGNRDGCDANWSWNCGVEGSTSDPQVLKLRDRQARNLMATLLVSQGVPMILAGDEMLRTQHGNNNAWCQDSEISWLNWEMDERQAAFHRFLRQMIALRKRHHVLRRQTFLNGQGHTPEIVWHGVEPCQPDFSHVSRCLALTLDGRRGDRPGFVDRDLYIAFNSSDTVQIFRIPSSPSARAWRRTVDTALPSPHDALGLDEGPILPVMHPYRVEPRSMIILVSEE